MNEGAEKGMNEGAGEGMDEGAEEGMSEGAALAVGAADGLGIGSADGAGDEVGLDVVGMTDGELDVGITVGLGEGAPYSEEATSSSSKMRVGAASPLLDRTY